MYMLDQSEWLRAYKGSGPHKIRHLCLQGNTYLSVPAVVSNTLPKNRAQKAISEFDAFASHSAGESGFVKRTAASQCKARRSQTHGLRNSNLPSPTGRPLRSSRAGQRRSNIAPDGRVQATPR